MQRLNDGPIAVDTYSLREVSELALGTDGGIHATWPSVRPDGSKIHTMYARQVGGTTIEGGADVNGFTLAP